MPGATVPLTLQLGGPMAHLLPILHNLVSLNFPPSMVFSKWCPGIRVPSV